ncbi:MAG: hypothetical protein HFI01_07970 [Lachnospiraceae bacterium]|jgi:hypothetical protein|nr:hypothetical protein [Lachnospiraceae bacterium]MCI9342898.1 hypothetical protein [Lachnospiraceae bacterium]
MMPSSTELKILKKFMSTHVDVDMNVNRSSYFTFHLVLHLLYDAYVDYMECREKE